MLKKILRKILFYILKKYRARITNASNELLILQIEIKEYKDRFRILPFTLENARLHNQASKALVECSKSIKQAEHVLERLDNLIKLENTNGL